MDKKILVKKLPAYFAALKADGINITRADLFPAEWRGHYTLALSADWKNLDGFEKFKVLRRKLTETLTHEIGQYVLNLYTYNTPEEIDAEMEFLTQYQTPVGESLLV
jgi:hypothetical protein